MPRDPCEAATGEMIALGPSPLPQVFLVMEETLHQFVLDCIGFRGLGFRGLGFRGLGFRGLSLGLRDSNNLGAAGLFESTVVPGNLSPSVGGLCIGLPHISGTPLRHLIYENIGQVGCSS